MEKEIKEKCNHEWYGQKCCYKCGVIEIWGRITGKMVFDNVMKKEIKEKIIEDWEIRFCNIWGDCKFDVGTLKKSCDFIRQDKQKWTEEKNIACIREYEKGERNGKQKLIKEIKQNERSEIVAGLLREYAGQESQIIDAVNFIHKLK